MDNASLLIDNVTLTHTLQLVIGYRAGVFGKADSCYIRFEISFHL